MAFVFWEDLDPVFLDLALTIIINNRRNHLYLSQSVNLLATS